MCLDIPGSAEKGHQIDRGEPARAALGRGSVLAAWALAVVVTLFAATVSVAGARSSAPPSRQLGTNLTLPTDSGSEVPFVDVFHLARPWVSQRDGMPYGQGGPLDLDSNGWVRSLPPGQHADTLMLDNGGHHPAGRYSVLYDGRGTLDFQHSARVVSSSVGRIDIEVPAYVPGAMNAISLRIVTTDPADYLRNIRVLLPGHVGDYKRHPFNPAFLDAIRPFATVRFMEWMDTNYNPPGDWSKRPTPQSATWHRTAGGVPVEVMVNLANTLHADPWFTLPHTATNDYVRRFATVVRKRLAPSLVPHVEYTNEAWNSVFPQSKYVDDLGAALGLSTDRYLAGLRDYSDRAVEVFSIWGHVFGHRRFHRVLATQSSPWALTQVLSWHGDFRRADEAAIAPYFGIRGTNDPVIGPQIAAWSVDKVLSAAEQTIRVVYPPIGAQIVAVTKADGLALVAYEGGQGLVGSGPMQNNNQLTDLLIAANRAPRMYDLYIEYLDEWQRLGGGLFMNYADVVVPSKYGSWGALEYLGQSLATAPKYRALLAWMGPSRRRG